MQTQSEKIEDIIGALVKAQAEIKSAEEDSTNPHFKSKYASYEAIRSACKQPLLKNGLVLTHHLGDENGRRVMITQITHTSGQWMRSYLILPQSDKETPQAVGSGISYAKRYSLSALLAMGTGEDDDAESASAPFREIPKLTIAQALEIEKLTAGDEELLDRIKSGYQVDSLTQINANCYQAIVSRLKARKNENS